MEDNSGSTQDVVININLKTEFGQEKPGISSSTTDGSEKKPTTDVQADKPATAATNVKKLDDSLKTLQKTLKDSAFQGFITFFDQLIDGTKSAKDAFGDMVKSILKDLAKMASQQLTESLFTAMNITTSGHAEGGYIVGPGSGTSDSIVARLSNGEYVMPAHAVQKYGVAFFESLRGGFSPSSIEPNMTGRFASGGFVGVMGGGGNQVTVPVSILGTQGSPALAGNLRREIESTVVRVLQNHSR